MNKKVQILEKVGEYNPINGLTPVQEQVALRLASGERISAIADSLHMSRTTIYQWQDLLTFRCYYNRLCQEVKMHLEESLLSMSEEVVQAIRTSLNSDNEAVRMRTAFWLVERILTKASGSTNPYKEIKKQCVSLPDEVNFIDSEKYQKEVEKMNLRLIPEEEIE